MKSFHENIKDIPPDIKCIQTGKGNFQNWPKGDCFFGVPSDALYGRKELDSIPKSTTSFHFYLGSNCVELLQSFAESDYIETVNELYIGNSCYNKGDGRDYRDVVSVLEKYSFPSLKHLELGVWQLFSNSHCAFGNLGNITNILTGMPNLEELFIYGNFVLEEAIELNKLKILQVQIDDYVTGINSGYPSVSSIFNILSSVLPNLKSMYLDLEKDEEQPFYKIPEVLMTGGNLPSLESFEIAGPLEEASLEKLRNSQFSQKPGIKFYLEDANGF